MTRFDLDEVSRPLSERGRVREGAGPAAPEDPADTIERSKERLARDLSGAKAELRAVEREVRHRARNVALAAVALLVAVLAVSAARASLGGRRRGLLRSLVRVF